MLWRTQVWELSSFRTPFAPPPAKSNQNLHFIIILIFVNFRSLFQLLYFQTISLIKFNKLLAGDINWIYNRWIKKLKWQLSFLKVFLNLKLK